MKVKILRHNGINKICINNEIMEPLSFKSFRPSIRNISEFSNAGVRLFSILTSGMPSRLKVPYSLFGESWIDDYTYDFSVIDNQIDFFVDNAAQNAYFALMIQLDTRQWWLDKNPQYNNSFTHLSQTAACNKWRAMAAEYLKAVITHVEEKYGEKFYGYFMLGGMTTEWFSALDFEEGCPCKEEAYRKYLNDPNYSIPQKDELEQSGNVSFIDPKEHENLIKYRRFHNELIADTILFFAGEAQTVLKHKKLLGVYYGYLTELTGARLWNFGSLDYERVFLSNDIDMISSPSSYFFRNFDNVSATMVTHDTLNIHNKIYYLEFDHRTYLASGEIEGHRIPGSDSELKTEAETIDVMRRDFMLCASKGMALWWFDMFEGWFSSKGIMTEVANMIDIAGALSKKNTKSISEIAVFADGESMYGVNKNSEINTDILSNQRGELAKIGAPYDFFSMSDLENINYKKYKLYIFLNSFMLSEKHRQIISDKIKSGGKTILWVYAPGYIEKDCLSLESMEKATNMRMKTLVRSEKEIVFKDIKFGFKNELDTLFYVQDEDAEVLARYKESAKAAVTFKNLDHFNSVYCGMGSVPAKLLREIAIRAGVFIYNYNDTATYINSNMIGVYTKTEAKIHIPCDGIYTDLFSGAVYKSNDNILILPREEKCSKLLTKTDEQK